MRWRSAAAPRSPTNGWISSINMRLAKSGRHMLTIAMLTALGRLDELKTHLSLTPNTGVSRDEVKEVLMQASIYAGVPAEMSAFNRANEVFTEMDAKAREEKK
jgi:4-carboxymuconolactone decarboxylase